MDIVGGADKKDERDKVVRIVKERQILAESSLDYNPMGIFPEGSVSNGRQVLPFKRGAFEALLSIKPLALQYEFDNISP